MSVSARGSSSRNASPATQYEDLEKDWHGGPPIRTSACPTFSLPARRISCEETSWRYCQVEANSRFWYPVWRVHDGLERSILGVDRLVGYSVNATSVKKGLRDLKGGVVVG